MNSTRKSIGSGILYTALSKYSNVLISILITAILARLLTPMEFGVIAIVMVFISFFQLLSDFGIGPAIIQNKGLTQNDIQSIFTFSIFFGIILTILFYLAAPFISHFYNEPALESIAKLLSLAILFFSCNVVPQSLNYKKLWFKQVGIISVVVQMITGPIAIFFAFKGFSYYALVIKSICDGLFIFIGNYMLSPVALNWKIKISSIAKISRFASYQFLFNFINYFSRNADNLLIGKYFNTTALGYYDKAYKLMMMPVQNLTHVISPVLQPVLSEFQDDKQRIYKAYLRVVKLLAIIGFPFSVFLYFAAPEIICILYGPQWVVSIPIFKILAFTVGIQIVLSSSGSIFQAANRADLLFVSGFLGAITMVGGITYGVFIGKSLEDVGYGLITAFIVTFFQCYYILIKLTLKHSLIKFLMSFVYPLIIASCLFVLMKLTSGFSNTNLYISLLLKTIQFITILFIMAFVTKDNRKKLINFFEKLKHNG